MLDSEGKRILAKYYSNEHPTLKDQNAGIVALTVYMSMGSAPDVPVRLLSQQSIVSKTKKKGESAIYRNPATPFGTPLTDTLEDGSATVYEALQKGLSINPSKDFLGHRVNDGPFVWQTFQQVKERIANFGSGLIKFAGLTEGSESMVGIFFKNSPNWTICDMACVTYNLVSVPCYDTFDSDALTHIVNHTTITVIAVSSENVEKLFAICGAAPCLKYLVVVDADKISPEVQQRADALKVQLITGKNLEALGRDNKRPPALPKPEDLLTICYTSGTTGVPKGVMLTHRNLISGIASFFARLPPNVKLTAEDRHLSYLPASHMFERIISVANIYSGCQIGYFRGDILKLFDDIALLRPTIFPSVPRLLGRLYDKVMAGIHAASPTKKFLFNYAFESKKKLLKQGVATNGTFWDKLVFKKIQARLGGCVRLMITGAAPIDPAIMEFLRIAVGCNVMEGYGQTETSATGTLTNWGDYQIPFGSHVGCPFSNSEVKLIDVPSMNYFSEDKPNPRGEICFRGPGTMKGYYKEPTKTAETLDSEGFVHTGDIGEMLPNGTLKIVDRVKNIFKLSQGEYIAPEKVEMKMKVPAVLQSFVYGDSLKASLVAVVIPDPESALPWAKEKGLKIDNIADFCANKEAKKLLLEEMTKHGIENKLHKFEIPKAIVLHTEPFSVENGMLTPTFKMKRNDVKKKYQSEIDAMYASL